MKLIEEVDWDYEQYYVYSDNWKCGIDGKDIPLVGVVEIMDLREFLNESELPHPEYPVEVSLTTLPELEYFSEEFLNEVTSSCGIENYEPEYADVIVYCGGIPLSLCGITVKVPKIEVEANYIEDYNVIYLKDTADVELFIEQFVKPRMSAIFGLIGFYLDKPWNMIGTTGWDLLEEYLGKGSAIKKSLARH